MNVESANTIPMREILSKLGIKPTATSEKELLYLSPFHKSHEPGFIVDILTNTWRDLNDSSSGDVITFVCKHLEFYEEAHTIIDAERWLKNIIGYVPVTVPADVVNFRTVDKKYRYEDHGHIQSPSLIEYLENVRAIPLDVAKYVMVEVTIHNTEKDTLFLALGNRTENNSYSIRNPNFKAQLKKPYPSFIRGTQENATGVHIFKDVFDYLSVIRMRNGKQFADDTIILNSYNSMPLTASLLYGYQRVYTWLDNTPEGKEATRIYNRFLKVNDKVVHKHMYKMFTGFGSLNKWLVAKHPLAPLAERI